MAEKNNANIGFEKQIWDAACELWGHIPAADYRKVIVGLIFLRYISCVFERKFQALLAEEEGFENDRDEYLAESIFFIRKKRAGPPSPRRRTRKKSARSLMKPCLPSKPKTGA